MKQWLQQLCHSATPSIDECVQQLGPVIPWLNDLKKHHKILVGMQRVTYIFIPVWCWTNSINCW